MNKIKIFVSSFVMVRSIQEDYDKIVYLKVYFVLQFEK